MVCVLQTAKLRYDANTVTGKNTKHDANYHRTTKLRNRTTTSSNNYNRHECFKDIDWTPLAY